MNQFRFVVEEARRIQENQIEVFPGLFIRSRTEERVSPSLKTTRGLDEHSTKGGVKILHYKAM
jgi:hypothetical protein